MNILSSLETLRHLLAELDQCCQNFASHPRVQVQKPLHQQLKKPFDLLRLLLFVTFIRRRNVFDENADDLYNSHPHGVRLELKHQPNLPDSIRGLESDKVTYLAIEMREQQWHLLLHHSRTQLC